MSFDEWIFWPVIVFLLFLPSIFKWVRKRDANNLNSVPNEAQVRWRKFDISKNQRPFLGWAGASRKSLLHISSDGIHCADFSIPFNKIKKATAYSPKDFGKGSYSILRLETSDEGYDFSISPYRLEKFQVPFEITHKETDILPKVFLNVILPALVLLIIIIILVIRYYLNI